MPTVSWIGKERGALDRHDRSLCMVYPRLVLFLQFRRNDGAIFVFIEDAECGHLLLLVDEIFGASNFVAVVIWKRADSYRNSARRFSTDHDFLLACSRGTNELIGPTWHRSSPPPGRFQRLPREKLPERDEDAPIWWGPSRSARLSTERYLTEVADLVPRTLWKKDSFDPLAEFVWFAEAGAGLSPEQRGKADSLWLGVHEGRSIYLRSNRMGGSAVREGITFKQTPYALEV